MSARSYSHFFISPTPSPSFSLFLPPFFSHFSSFCLFFQFFFSESLVFSVFSFHLCSFYIIEMNTNNVFYLPDARGTGIKESGSPAVEHLTGETDKCIAKLKGSSRCSGSSKEGLSGYWEWGGGGKRRSGTVIKRN